MQWSRPRIMPDGCPARKTLRRLTMRRAAMIYGERGWPVVAGACLLGDRFTCGLGCRTVSCHPIADGWEDHATTDTAAIAGTWEAKPYSVLLATGSAFDVLDMPAYMGALASEGVPGPVATTPGGRWMFLVRPGGRLLPELAGQYNVVLHAGGSWIPAPPVPTPHGRVRWEVAPHETDWRIPHLEQVQVALLATLPWLGTVPRLA